MVAFCKQHVSDDFDLIEFCQAFEISANSVTSDLDEHLQLIAISIDGEETTIHLKSENEDCLVEETTLVKNEAENFISFATQNLSSELQGSPVVLLYSLS